jgi:archaellum component FlaC
MISPGASWGSSNRAEETLNTLQNQQEIENLKSEIRDLQEKIETLKGTIMCNLRVMLGIQYTVISSSIVAVKSKVTFFDGCY